MNTKDIEEYEWEARKRLGAEPFNTPKDIEELKDETVNIWAEQDIYQALDYVITTLTNHHEAEVNRRVEAERERMLQLIQNFIDDNSGYDYSGDILLSSLASLIEKSLTPHQDR